MLSLTFRHTSQQQATRSLTDEYGVGEGIWASSLAFVSKRGQLSQAGNTRRKGKAMHYLWFMVLRMHLGHFLIWVTQYCQSPTRSVGDVVCTCQLASRFVPPQYLLAASWMLCEWVTRSRGRVYCTNLMSMPHDPIRFIYINRVQRQYF
jgi:hypothetical protein